MSRETDRKWDTVAIVGVGLIGGSIGLALQAGGYVRRVIGIGRNPNRLQAALDRGAVTSVTSDLSSGVAEADLTIVCTPIESVVSFVQQVMRACPEGSLITDVGSTKGEICNALASSPAGSTAFVGSHPMAGSEKSGVEFASENLFRERVTVVTPVASTRKEHTTAIVHFWESLGARVLCMDPEDHDHAVAAVSHLPHLVASALAASTPTDCLELAAGGWHDTTRIAAGEAELWRQILVENRGHVLQMLDKFEKVLAEFREALAEDRQMDLTRLLAAGKQKRDSLGSGHSSSGGAT